jgi:UDP-glucose 4-epimerase
VLTLLHATSVPPRRVVVVGSGGFVGNAIAARLERDAVPLARLTRREVDLLASGAADRLAARLADGDVLVAAAAIAPCKSPEMLRDNTILAAALVKAAAARRLSHVVNISSDAVYADSPEPLRENSTTAPDTLHGVMHLAREIMVKAALNVPATTLRPSLLYGAGDPHNGYGPNRFRRLAAKGEPIVLFGDGEERRDHVLIDDLAELCARVIYRRAVGVLNVATGVTTSFRAVARAVIDASGRQVPIVATPRSGSMPHNGYRPFDSAVCRAAFPDFAYTPLAAGIAQAQRAEPA